MHYARDKRRVHDRETVLVGRSEGLQTLFALGQLVNRQTFVLALQLVQLDVNTHSWVACRYKVHLLLSF